MKKIFVTAVGGDIGYAVIKSLKKSGHNVYIWGCDTKKYNSSYDLVDAFLVCPPYKDENIWIDFMLKALKSNKIDFFWPVTEAEIKIVNAHRESFDFVKLMINDPNVLLVALDKGKTAEYLAENGVLTPKTWHSVTDAELSFPMIVKEKFGCGSHSVAIVHNKMELHHEYHKMENPIIQNYVGEIAEEYTLTIFSDGEVINHIAFKRELGLGGMSRYVELVEDHMLRMISERIANAFKLRGSINVQLRKQDDNYYVFEINPRISSTMGFRLQLGFNDVSWWLDMKDGKTIEKYTYPSQKICGVRTVDEKLFYI